MSDLNRSAKMDSRLQGVDLSDSWVIGWNQKTSEVAFDVDFSLWPESPFYREPKKDEWTCYRKGVLRFVGVTAVSGLKSEDEVRFTVDPDGYRDCGNIESFVVDADGVRLSGDFGDVSVKCSEWQLEIR